MVARSPPKLHQWKTPAAPLDPIRLRETLKKVDKCVARLEELQCTVTGGKGIISGAGLSPRSTRAYLRATSLRCKQDSIRIKNGSSNRSPRGKLPANAAGEWKRMSLPAMLLGETVTEILQASQFAREVVEAAAAVSDDPKTPPVTIRRTNKNPGLENSELRARRKREKEEVKAVPRPSLRRARSRINFKVSPPPHKTEEESPSPPAAASQQQKTSRTKSPVFSRTGQQKTPHKFLIKSPNPPSRRFQVKIRRSPPLSISPPPPTRAVAKDNKSPKISTAGRLKRSLSPSRFANRMLLASSSPSKIRRSFSPSRLANKLVSPLKSRRKSVQINSADAMKMMMSGLKQQPSSTSSLPMQFPARRL
ncbi:unnamed protein product [Cuscuta campestris]|uniref:Microtubule-binding protein TANGLED1 n=1 Tax=Cuscuta campestris TaxID=132261 RepID=A0A484KUV7_9ASTE|nr:unnamed protein product [Cuscuta campestris]